MPKLLVKTRLKHSLLSPRSAVEAGTVVDVTPAVFSKVVPLIKTGLLEIVGGPSPQKAVAPPVEKPVEKPVAETLAPATPVPVEPAPTTANVDLGQLTPNAPPAPKRGRKAKQE